jgi:hypothetical protein
MCLKVVDTRRSFDRVLRRPIETARALAALVHQSSVDCPLLDNLPMPHICRTSRRPDADREIRVLQGTLEMVILKIVELGPVHGYGISQRIRQRLSIAAVQTNVVL